MLFVLFRGRQGILRLCLLASTIATPEDAYTDADLFDTIRQIRGDELDGAGSASPSLPW
jgi:hypothetical protein